MKYIKKLNIDFNNWEEIDNEFLIPYLYEIEYNKFINFLRYEEIYDKFVNNLKNYDLTKNFLWIISVDKYDKFFLVDKPITWITSSFDWGHTNDGYIYWAKINDKWGNILYN